MENLDLDLNTKDLKKFIYQENQLDFNKKKKWVIMFHFKPKH